MRILYQKTLQQAFNFLFLPALQAIFLSMNQVNLNLQQDLPVFEKLPGEWKGTGPYLATYLVYMVLGLAIIIKKDCRECQFERTKPGCQECLAAQIRNNTIMEALGMVLQLGLLALYIKNNTGFLAEPMKLVFVLISILPIALNAYLIKSNLFKKPRKMPYGPRKEQVESRRRK